MNTGPQQQMRSTRLWHCVVTTNDIYVRQDGWNRGCAKKELPIAGEGAGIHVLHTMGDFFDIEAQLVQHQPKRAAIVGAGYVGIEMAEALTRRDVSVTLIQRGSEVLSTVEPDLGASVHDALT